MSSLNLHRLSSALGAEVIDLDLAALADGDPGREPAVADSVRGAWQTHHLLLFRHQRLSPVQQASVATWFGQVEGATPQEMQRGEAPGDPVHYISNRVPDGRAGDGELLFHSDSSTRPHPIRAVSLFALDVPDAGGETRFANCSRAYQRLPDALKRRVQDLEALHGYDYDTLRKTDGTSGNGFSAVHPVVLSHPITGEPILFVSRNFTHHIVGWPETASRDLLEELWSYVEADDIVYQHPWEPGELVIWDNVALQHARTAFDPAKARTLQRVTVSGASAFPGGPADGRQVRRRPGPDRGN
jgi:alpha-ketoglutarate-dependent taurine dioxygenase